MKNRDPLRRIFGPKDRKEADFYRKTISQVIDIYLDICDNLPWDASTRDFVKRYLQTDLKKSTIGLVSVDVFSESRTVEVIVKTVRGFEVVVSRTAISKMDVPLIPDEVYCI